MRKEVITLSCFAVVLICLGAITNSDKIVLLLFTVIVISFEIGCLLAVKVAPTLIRENYPLGQYSETDEMLELGRWVFTIILIGLAFMTFGFQIGMMVDFSQSNTGVIKYIGILLYLGSIYFSSRINLLFVKKTLKKVIAIQKNKTSK
ncbi:hypothetical protein ACRYI5_01445 [Furfurilactobacillus sp. WILCCON 0119]